MPFSSVGPGLESDFGRFLYFFYHFLYPRGALWILSSAVDSVTPRSLTLGSRGILGNELCLSLTENFQVYKEQSIVGKYGTLKSKSPRSYPGSASCRLCDFCQITAPLSLKLIHLHNEGNDSPHLTGLRIRGAGMWKVLSSVPGSSDPSVNAGSC